MSSSFYDKLKAQEERVGLPPGTLASIVQQETSGKADYQVDPGKYHYEIGADGKRRTKDGTISSAFGPFGILEDTTGRRPGYGVAPLKDKSLDEQMRFSADYLAARIKSAGSLKGGLAGYGEGAKYADSVMKRVHRRGTQQDAQTGQTEFHRPNNEFGSTDTTTAVEAGEANVKRATTEANTGIIDVMQTSFMDPRDNPILNVVQRLQSPSADPSFSYYDHPDRMQWEAKTGNMQELEFLRENANSAEKAQWALGRIEQDREADTTYGNAGVGASFVGRGAVSLVDPVGWIAGAGVGKVARLARIGITASRVGAVAAVAAENAVGNVLWDGVQDAMGETKTAQDYVMSAGFGVGFSALRWRSAIKHADAQARLNNALSVDPVGDHSGIAGAAGDAAEVSRVHEQSGAEVDAVEVQEMRERMAQGGDAAASAQVRNLEVERANAMRTDADDVAIPHDLADEMRMLDEDEPTSATSHPIVAEPAQVVETAPRTPEAVPTVTVTKARIVRDALDGTSTELTLSDGSAARIQKLSAAESEGRPGWHLVDSTEQHTFLGNTKNEAVAELVKRRSDERAITPSEAHADAPDLNYSTESTEFSEPTAANMNETRSLGEALEEAADSPSAMSSPLTRNLLKYLSDAVPKSVKDDIAATFYDGIRGRYRDGLRQIDTPGSSAKGMRGGEANVLAHEAVHAATVGVMKAILRGDKVPELAKQSMQRLQELFAEFKEHMAVSPEHVDGKEFGATYAEKNIFEFVAQVMSDSETRSVLARMQGRLYAANDALATFIRGVMGLLGFNPKKVPPNTALAETLAHIDTLIRTQGNFPDGVSWKADLNAPGGLNATTDRNFATRMYAHAAQYLGSNPINPAKLEVLAQQVLKKGSAIRNVILSDGLKLAASNNPIFRMMSGLIVETTTGAAGRRTTAAIKKDMLHKKIIGRSVQDYNLAYHDYRRVSGGGTVEDFMRGDVKRQFDKAVFEEILNRRYSNPLSQSGAVRAGADAMQAIYERSLRTQKEYSLLGSHYLPMDAEGYVPQALQGDKLASASAAEIDELAKHLSTHWQGFYGWNKQFTDEFARVYIDRSRKRANGQDGIDYVATQSPSEAVRDTLEEMRLSSRSLNNQAKAELDRVGAAPMNRSRLDVDLLATLPSGTRVLDFFNTDVEKLARQHANRVSGHAALSSFNVLGQRGVNNILLAADLAEPHLRAMPEEREAMARVFSEFLGQPVAGEYRSRFAANAAGVVRLQRLGGLAFTQLSEIVNMLHHLGLGSLVQGIAILPRMIREVRTIKHGGTAANSWLASIEQHQGFDFGMEMFHMEARMDPPDDMLREYGKGNDIATRAIAGGNHLQAQLSFFRGIHAAQHRATAEMILKKAIGYIQDGGNNKYLEDMGITPKLAQAIKGDLVRAIKRDASGNAIGFDITQLTTSKAQTDLLASIHRGTSQIIQGTFIGERGAWAHNDVQKLFLQLRTFGLTSMEKQWGRTRVLNSDGPLNGYGYAAGVLMAQMAFAVPIYLARAQIYAMGREDRDEFLERATAPASMVTAAMNYSSMSGLAGDAFDMVASLGGSWDSDVKDTLGTKGDGGGVGSVVPVGGTVDSAWRVLAGKSTLHSALKQLPMSNLPWITPIINLTAEE